MTTKFGPEYTNVWPRAPVHRNTWTNHGKKLLEVCAKVERPKPITVDELIKNSNEFPIKVIIITITR